MTKKKIFLKVSVLLLFVLMPVLLLFSACKNDLPKNYYFTVENSPAHVSLEITSKTGGFGSDDKGRFINEGHVVRVAVQIENGYNLGPLKVLKNGKELTLTQESKNYYFSEFECVEDFSITFSGSVSADTVYVRLESESTNSTYHDRIMVEIDEYQLFGLEKGIMTFAEYKQSLSNNGFSLYSISMDTPITVSVYTVGAYDIVISKSAFVSILHGDALVHSGYNMSEISVIADDENNKYGYSVTINFTENDTTKTIQISDEVLIGYRVEFKNENEIVSMNKDLFAMSVANEDRSVKEQAYGYYQGELFLSDFKTTALPKLKIDFLKYADENYKQFYDALNFEFNGKSAEKSADGSFVQIEFDKFYNYDFSGDKYYVSTNVLEILKQDNKIVKQTHGIVDTVEVEGADAFEQHDFPGISEETEQKYVGISSVGELYFFKDETIIVTIDFYSIANFEYVRLGDIVIKVGDMTNENVSVKNELYDYSGDEQASRFIITAKAVVALSKIEFFANNPSA